MRPRHLIITASYFILCACASGGGHVVGSTFTPAGTSPQTNLAGVFIEFEKVEPGRETTIFGYSRETRITPSSDNKQVESIGAPTNFAQGVVFGYTKNVAGWYRFLSAARTEPYFSSGYWDYDAEGGTLAQDSRLHFVQAPGSVGYVTSVGYVANPVTVTWNYQTFGIWSAPSTQHTTMGVFTVGAPTAGNAVPSPATGSASYAGFAIGNYIASDGTRSLARADMALQANFENSRFGLSLSNSQVLSASGSWVANSNLNLTGTLSGAASANGFSGAVATAGGGAGNAPMSGTANGLFYGPNGDEVGGAFWVSGAA